MSESLVITISHKLGKEEALRRFKPALSKAAGSFPVLKVEEEIWSGDRLDFRLPAGMSRSVTTRATGSDIALAAAQIWPGRAAHRRRSRPYRA